MANQYPFLKKIDDTKYVIKTNEVGLTGHLEAISKDLWKIVLEHDNKVISGLVPSFREITAEQSAKASVAVILSKLNPPNNETLIGIKRWYFSDWDEVPKEQS